jgi:predicted transglutaminase-like cysteine proteinase
MGFSSFALLATKPVRALAAGLGVSLLAACASAPPQATSMPLGNAVQAPAGLVDFCARAEADCAPAGMARASGTLANAHATLTGAGWRELNEVNYALNHAIRPATDLALYHKTEFWQYPDGSGDCEDFALAKRRALIARGWPEESLLFATARIPSRELHAVLVVSTDHGDFVLDNASDFVEPWSALPYQWVARQTPGEMLSWRRAGTGSTLSATASLQ